MTSDAFFEKIQQHLDNELPFVVYRKPKAQRISAFLQNNAEVYKTSQFTESGFVFAPFDDREDAILIPNESSESIRTIMSSKAEIDVDNTQKKNNEIPDSIGMTEHINLIQKGIDTIQKGKLKKVVLSRKESVELEEHNPITIFKSLLKAYDEAFAYLWYHPKIGLWLGSTPETLVTVVGSRLETMALAGTQMYRDSLDVVWGEKEQEEQRLVTDFIVDSLQSFIESLRVSEPKTVRAGHLLHLKTSISGVLKLSNLNLEQLLQKLHPTPAICGLPKDAAKAFILNNEAYKREFYTGFLGELNLKSTVSRNRNKRNVENSAFQSIKTVTSLFVNLRCMKIEDHHASIYIGGGITKDSVSEDEWLETVNKAKTMKKVL